MLILSATLFLVAFDHIGKYFERDINHIESSSILATPYQDEVQRSPSGEEVVDEDRPALNVVTSTEQIKDYIILKAFAYDVPEDIALKISECESGFRNVCNFQYGCSGGIGIYQITKSTFDETVGRMFTEADGMFCPEGMLDDCVDVWSPYNIKDNINVGIYLMSKSEYWRWRPSQECWKGTYAGGNIYD